MVAALLVVAAAGAGTWYFALRTTDDDRYVAALKSEDLFAQYGSEEAAIAQAHAFCAKLKAGDKPTGFRTDQIAVANLCPSFLSGFEVVPTPDEQREEFTKKLRSAGLGGKFASDAAAVAYAQSVCNKLDSGGAQQGPDTAAIAVGVYCDKYADGFKTLKPIKVEGSITLIESSPGFYYQSIVGSRSFCQGASGYADITAGSEVVIKDGAGKVLTRTQLGRGTGSPPYSCKLPFKFTVLDGASGGYVVEIGNRGDVHFSAASLKVPGGVALTLGN